MIICNVCILLRHLSESTGQELDRESGVEGIQNRESLANNYLEK